MSHCLNMTVSDLSPDALARLEAKLVADLEMVRKVRALLEEHHLVLGAVAGSLALLAPTLGAASPSLPESVPLEPPVPRKSLDVVAFECLPAMPEAGFRLEDLRRAVGKVIHNYPDGPVIKTFINRMIRKGSVIVLESRAGRNGSIYRCTLPKPVSTEKAEESAEKPPASSI